MGLAAAVQRGLQGGGGFHGFQCVGQITRLFGNEGVLALNAQRNVLGVGLLGGLACGGYGHAGLLQLTQSRLALRTQQEQCGQPPDVRAGLERLLGGHQQFQRLGMVALPRGDLGNAHQAFAGDIVHFLRLGHTLPLAQAGQGFGILPQVHLVDTQIHRVDRFELAQAQVKPGPLADGQALGGAVQSGQVGPQIREQFDSNRRCIQRITNLAYAQLAPAPADAVAVPRAYLHAFGPKGQGCTVFSTGVVSAAHQIQHMGLFTKLAAALGTLHGFQQPGDGRIGVTILVNHQAKSLRNQHQGSIVAQAAGLLQCGQAFVVKGCTAAAAAGLLELSNDGSEGALGGVK